MIDGDDTLLGIVQSILVFSVSASRSVQCKPYTSCCPKNTVCPLGEIKNVVQSRFGVDVEGCRSIFSNSSPDVESRYKVTPGDWLGLRKCRRRRRKFPAAVG